MGKAGMKGLVLSIVLALTAPVAAGTSAAAADKTTKYRVYQNEQLLMEFADYKQAEQYARGYADSRVEEIGSGAWRWDNYPRYQIYQYGMTQPSWEFAKLEDAIREASNWGHASIRDLQGTGWVWNNYPRYQVYQNDETMDSWSFTTLNAANAEANRWSSSHIIDLTNNQWVWDNLTAQRKQELRSGAVQYQIYQNTYTQDDWRFSYLEDAVKEAQHWGNSTIVRLTDGKTIFSNDKRYKVYQNETLLDEFLGLDQAADYARLWNNASIRLNGAVIWNNYPTYSVYQNKNLISGFYSLTEALQYAKLYSNASIRRLDGMAIWNNVRKLQFWAWNGASSKDTILSQVSATQGLDVDSPSWFQLADAQGSLKDTSNKDAASQLQKLGIQVHPLVSNQFDAALTSDFLANAEAQDRFITALVKKASELKVQGINVDFESVNAKDRAKYTTFISKLAGAAHSSSLQVSVDLPRGSVKWNHLTAYDHEKLAQYADYIMTMTYDQYYSGSSSPGSVAGLQWVEEGVNEFLSYGIPHDKLIMGIPFYTREWSLDASGSLTGNKAVYAKDLAAVISTKKPTATWDSAFNQYKMEYTGEDGNKRVFWLESADTVAARLEIAKKYQLAGVAAWRLGQEDPDFWNKMLQQK